MRTHRGHRVYHRTHWDDDWEEIPYLYAENVTWAMAPTFPSALLSYNAAAEIMRPDQQSFGEYPPLDLDRHYIRIEFDQDDPNDPDEAEPQGVPPLVWHGIALDDSRNCGGDDNVGSPRARQSIACLGLEWLLTKQLVDSSVVMLEGGSEQRIKRGIAFNLGGGDERSRYRIGNVSGNLFGGGQVGEKGVPIFAATIEDGVQSFEWTAPDILSYLFIYHAPGPATGDQTLPLYFDSQTSGFENLKYYRPVLPVQGRSLYELVSQVVDRRRGLGWWLEVDEESEGGTILLRVRSLAEQDISLPSGETFLANDDQGDWDFDQSRVHRDAIVRRSSEHVYQRVVARGERLVICGSFFPGDFEKDWLDGDAPDDHEDQYDKGASEESGYDDLESFEQHVANQQARSAYKLARVYRAFRLIPDFDFDSVVPNDEAVSGLIWYPGVRFLDRLPLKTDHEYEDAKISGEQVVDNTPEHGGAEYLAPFGVLEENGRHLYIDKLGQGAADEVVPREFNVSLRMQDEAPGIVLDLGGHAQHLIAADEFTPATDDSYDEADKEIAIDWKDMKFTLALLADEYAEAAWPEDVEDSDADLYLPLVIEVPEARLDWIAAQTIVRVDPDGTAKTSEGGYVQDDRDLLSDVARVAYQWYSTPRQALDVPGIHSLTPQVRLGQLITSIGSAFNDQPINSVVSEITLNTRAGTHGVKTQFAELDPSTFVPQKKLSGQRQQRGLAGVGRAARRGR